jgi:hypothetical protein
VSDAFEVTEYAKSAAARKLGSGPARTGTITAAFAAAWEPGEQAPADESEYTRGGSDGTGRGSAVGVQDRAVNRVIVLVRDVVSLRYSKP